MAPTFTDIEDDGIDASEYPKEETDEETMAEIKEGGFQALKDQHCAQVREGNVEGGLSQITLEKEEAEGMMLSEDERVDTLKTSEQQKIVALLPHENDNTTEEMVPHEHDDTHTSEEPKTEETAPYKEDRTEDRMLPAQNAEEKLSPLSYVKGDDNVAAQEDADDQEAESHLPQTPFTGFRPKITDWNEQRQAWLFENPEFALHEGKLNILLVTSSSPKPCDNPQADYYLLKFSKNKIDYCRLHGIEFFYSMAQFESGMNDFWSKLPVLRKLLLSHPEMEWIWWMDNDAIFTDMSFELPMEKYKQHNLVLHGWGDEVYIKKSWMGLNAGIFLIRNCQWSLNFMDAWAFMGANQKVREEAGKLLAETLTDRPMFEADDQSALVYLLTTEKKLWESKVYLEYSYSLHGYWEAIVDRYEELMEGSHPGFGDERWPFVTHFVGCKPCKSSAFDKCLTQMERAFNFGDNQVLQYYGFQHRNLGSVKVKRIWNETSQSSNETNPSMADSETRNQSPAPTMAMIDGTIS